MSTAEIKTLTNADGSTVIYPRTTVEAVSGFENINSHITDTANPHKVTRQQIGAVSADKIIAPIAASSWSSNQVTVSNSLITNDGIILVSPAPESYIEWGTCKVRATGQSSGALIFECDETPSVDITAYIVVIGG